MTLTSTDWVSISNSPEELFATKEEDSDLFDGFVKNYRLGRYINKFDNNECRVSVFEQTQTMAPYLFAIVAGPYVSVTKEAQIGDRVHPIKMRYLCRASR